MVDVGASTANRAGDVKEVPLTFLIAVIYSS